MSIINRIKQMKETQPLAGKPVRRRKVAPAVDTQKEWPSDGMPKGIGFIERCVKLADSEPEPTRGGSDYVHASALVSGDWCPRAHLIQSKYIKGQAEPIRPQQRIVWALGRAAEKHVRDQFIRMHGRHRCIGVWSCKCEKTTHVGEGVYDKLCQTCGGELDRYGELGLIDEVTRKAGNPDLIYFIIPEELRVLEIKSIKKDSYEGLTAPIPEHTLQCESYVRMLRQKCPDKGVVGSILYVAKDYVKPSLSPYREFPLPTHLDEILNLRDEQLAEMRSHEASTTLPARLPSCGSPTSMRAKNCVACGLCFSL